MTTRQAPDTRAITLMLVLCAVWGMQQVVLKATAADISPIMQIALRSGVAALLVGLLVGLLMWWRKERMRVSDGTQRRGLGDAAVGRPRQNLVNPWLLVFSANIVWGNLLLTDRLLTPLQR